MRASIISSHSHSHSHSLLLRSVPSSFSTFFSKPSATAAFSTVCFHQFKPSSSTFLTRKSPHYSRPFTPSTSLSFSRFFSSTVSGPSEVRFDEGDDEIEDKDESDYEDEVEMEDSVGDGTENGVASELSSPVMNRNEVKNIPSLTIKEKKELASYAHGLGKKLKSQLVGKSGVTPGLATSFIETLEANELLKIKILGNCPEDLEDVVRKLEESTGSVVVNQIGRTVIIYRPSITKMKAEEEKRRSRKIYIRKEPDRVKSILQKKVETPRSSNRGRRGTSRYINLE
ncbi:hypothetical protein IC575_001453 [Cucumis melo]|uniref:Uncharacterized protein LOC103490350 n=1 Tax=Cucumis melo TaxID=3656 RepID=A0A1S3BJF7_CUCME|nr:uncharacterized protein LOC103490350 [Cucumis melo]